MKTAVIIGGYGHIGSYLVPTLVENGYDVTVISRGIKKPWTSEMSAWDKVKSIVCDRHQMASEKKFGSMIAEMNPDLVFDAVSYTKETVEELCDGIMAKPSLASKVKLIQIGSIWIYAYKLFSPVTEDHVHNAVCPYGIGKTEIEEYLHNLSAEGKINTTVLHPGHISGKEWYPVNPQGNADPKVYANIVSGREIILPDNGSHTLHHVHSADIAGLTMACINNMDASCGQAFHAVSKQAITLRGFAELLYKYYGNEPNISYLPYNEFIASLDEKYVNDSMDHLGRSPACSMEKAEKLLGFVPKYSAVDIAIESIDYMMNKGLLIKD